MTRDKGPANESTLWQAILSGIVAAWPPARWCDVGVVVGCSGGADSVALVRALAQLRHERKNATGFLVAAHFHHGLRGSEADADAQFVRELADALGIRVQLGLATERATDEAAMRNARVAFLRETAQNAGARYVTVAHSADDNIETVLHHLMRGTGPSGLAGIPFSRAMGADPIGQDLVLIRPLLSVRRESIRSGLRELGQTWREDVSNADTVYRRNWIRGELLPLMQSQFPNVADAVTRAIELQNDWKETIDELAREWVDAHVTVTDTVTIQRQTSTQSPIIVAGLQSVWTCMGWPRGEMTQEHWLRLSTTIQASQQHRYSLPGNVDVNAASKNIVISRPQAADDV